jgi:hypothetical protein
MVLDLFVGFTSVIVRNDWIKPRKPHLGQSVFGPRFEPCRRVSVCTHARTRTHRKGFSSMCTCSIRKLIWHTYGPMWFEDLRIYFFYIRSHDLTLFSGDIFHSPGGTNIRCNFYCSITLWRVFESSALLVRNVYVLRCHRAIEQYIFEF